MYTTGSKREVKTIFPDEAKDFIAQNKEGSYTLLDVRQPEEYEEFHIPGAKLIPLPELVSSLEKLDLTKPALVYCAVGGRSQTAAQFLIHRGFKEVFQLMGGIEAWEEGTAQGPVGFHLQFIRGDETAEEVVRLAYAMEDGLKRVHEAMREKTTDSDLKELLNQLIRADESHKKTILGLLPAQAARDCLMAQMESHTGGPIEGGIDPEQLMSQNEHLLESVPEYLDLAMMVETQALDLYLHMADASKNMDSKQILLHIADEEKVHLSLLGGYLSDYLRRHNSAPKN